MDEDHWDAIHLVVADDDTGTLVPTGRWATAGGLDLEGLRSATEGACWGIGEDLAGKAAARRQPQAVPDAEEETDPSTRVQAARQAGFRSAMACPAEVQGRVVAVLECFGREPVPADRAWSDPWAATVDAVSRAAASIELSVELDHLEAIVDSFEDPITALDDQWRYTFLNEQAVETLPDGRGERDVLGERIWDVFPGLEGTRAEDRLREAMRTREPARVEEYDESNDEWWETRVYPLGEGVSIIQEDVTEAHRVRQQADRRRRNLQLAEKVAGLGHWSWDLRRDEVEWSRGCYDVHGRDPDAFEPSLEAFLGCIHPEDRERVQREIEQAVDEVRAFECDYTARNPDGEQRVVHAQARVETEEGHPIHVLGTVHDVTENRRREQELHRQQQNLELAEKIGQLGHWEWDVEADEVEWSTGHYRLYGLDPDAFEPSLESYLDRVHPEDQERVRQSIEQALETGEPLSFDHRIRHPVDGTRIVEVQGRLEHEADGQPTRMFGVSKDVTENRRREQELREAKEAAEQANRAKSAFLSNTSHEIRTPMNAVTGMTSLLLDTELTEEQEEYVRTIRHSGDHLLTLINDILDLSKIQAGRMDVEKRPVRLRTVVEEALDLVSQQAAQKGLETGYLIEEEVSEGIRTDAARLRQILVNLLGNAVKFTDEGEIRLDVSLEDPDEDLLRFDVQDTGIGISEEDQERLFTSFTQVDPSPSRRHQGTGLGLAICKRLTGLLDGEIWVESQPGEGSTFTFTIQAQPADVSVEEPEALSPVVLEDRRIVVVDDNATNREILEHYLRAWEMQPVLFSDPREALDWLEQTDEPVDLVILDQQMPDVDGIEVASRIQKNHPPQELAVMILTSMIRDPEAVEEADVDLAAYLTKPIKPSELYDVLIGIFNGKDPDVDLAAAERERRVLDPEMAERLPLRILVAEDNPVSQKVLARLLEKLGYDPDLVGTGGECLQALETVPYDVVVMDVQMPGMDGYTTTERIREGFGDDRQPRVIALTAHAGRDAERQAERSGMDDYVAKPISAEELVSALNKAIPLGPEARALEPAEEDEPVGDERTVEEEPILDDDKIEDLRRILGDGDEGVDGLVDTFTDRMPDVLSELEQAAGEGDLEEVGSLAHKVKGEASTLGARRLSVLAKRIENEARSDELDDPGTAVETLRSVYEQTEAAFRRQSLGG